MLRRLFSTFVLSLLGQLFIGDQGHCKIMRAALEKVDGVYQGVVFPFRQAFQSGVLRMIRDLYRGMCVGQTSRGWDAMRGTIRVGP